MRAYQVLVIVKIGAGFSIPQPMLKKIPIAPLQSGCARILWVPHQNKAASLLNIIIIVDKSYYRFY